MEDQMDRDFRLKAGKDVKCPFHPGILCSEWMIEGYKETCCPNCGWHPQEETRRKKRLKELVASGQWVPHLYSISHYG